MNIDTCEQFAASLSSGTPLGPAGERHMEHCPACASLARLPGLIQELSRDGVARTAVELQPGFHSRTVARANQRLSRRRQTRVLRTAALATCAAFVVVGSATVLPSVWRTESDTASATRPAPSEPSDERTPVARDEAAPDSPTPESDVLDTRDLSRLTNWSQLDRSLSFRADWRAAGGQVSAEDIARQKRSLELTAEQEKALRRIIDERRQRENEIRARLGQAKLDLRAQIDSDNPDEAAVGKAIERISELEARVRKGRVLSWLRARKLLDPEQRRRLAGPDSERRTERADVDDERDRASRERVSRRRSPGDDFDDGFDMDVDMDVDMSLDIDLGELDDMDRIMEQALREMDVDQIIDRAFDQVGLERALERAEQRLEQHPGVGKEDFRRMREEFRRAREQMREELSRARRELELQRPKIERLREDSRRDLERMRQDALREAERAREHALREAERTRERAARARERAERERERAARERERAARERERSDTRRDANKD